MTIVPPPPPPAETPEPRPPSPEPNLLAGRYRLRRPPHLDVYEPAPLANMDHLAVGVLTGVGHFAGVRRPTQVARELLIAFA